MNNLGIIRLITGLLMAVCLLIVSSPLVSAADIKPQYGGTLRVADSYEGASIGYPPKMTKTLFAMRQASPAIETLLRVNKAGQLVQWLATGYKESSGT
jgi:hypothetical protein